MDTLSVHILITFGYLVNCVKHMGSSYVKFELNKTTVIENYMV